MADFQKGDTVRLKSGGPLMTIQNLGQYRGVEEGAECVWFEGTRQEQCVFDVAVLEKSEPRSGVGRVVRG